MTGTIRVGGRGTLNIYTAKLRSDMDLGYSYFPYDYRQIQERDGVFIRFDTVPGGDRDYFNMGMTAVHETGHWLGLYHTFQPHTDVDTGVTDGCVSPGDYITDTPYQRVATEGCPAEPPNSCPGRPWRDPIREWFHILKSEMCFKQYIADNFMDYSDDICMREFTPMQAKRIRPKLRLYRGLTSQAFVDEN
ncbi:hypothetical protein H0H92_010242 [Tricholoma furcatifolium]|nr:hypothetical protein H0H92_010242 [Tricholoma furcatifolium]